MSKLEGHYCGFIPGDGSERMKLLYCCPNISSNDELSARSNFDGCKTKDGREGTCVEDEECTSAWRIIDNNLRDLFHTVKQNRCGDGKVCCADEEILKGNQCFNDRMEIGVCEHYSECDEFATLVRKHQLAGVKISEKDKLIWSRGKCKPKEEAVGKFKSKVSRNQMK